MSKKEPTPQRHQGSVLGNRGKKKEPEVQQASIVEKKPVTEPVKYHSEPVERHADKEEDKLVSKSYTIYQSDDGLLADMIPDIGNYTRAKIKKSTVVRLAIKYLHEKMQNGGKGFDADIERLLKDCL